MFFRSVVVQTRSCLKQSGSIITFLILLAFVLQNFILNVQTYQGDDVLSMVHPMKLLVLNEFGGYLNLEMFSVLLQVYPLLLPLPAVIPYAKERQTGESILLAARIGGMRYAFSRLLSVLITTFIIFTVPFLIEIGLNCISFPLEAQGDPLKIGIYDPKYPEMVRRYLFSGLYIRSPYLYAVVETLFWGLCSAIFAAFSAAFVAVFRFKFTVFYLLPVYLFLNATTLLSAKVAGTTVWYYYVLPYNERLKNPAYLWVLPILLLIAVLATARGGRRDCIG